MAYGVERPVTKLGLKTPGQEIEILIPEKIDMGLKIEYEFDNDFAGLYYPLPANEPSNSAVPKATNPEKISQPSSTTTGLPTPAKGALPKLESLPRPEQLFPSMTPYHIIVESRPDKITVQSSHQPCLNLLTSYLKKNIRFVDNTADKVRPFLTPTA